jgi:hypothetical protein
MIEDDDDDDDDDHRHHGMVVINYNNAIGIVLHEHCIQSYIYINEERL